jgi:hypothetical protein
MSVFNFDLGSAIALSFVAFLAGIGQETAKELFIFIRKYRDKAKTLLKNGK